MRQGFERQPYKGMGFLILCIWNIYFKYKISTLDKVNVAVT